MNLGILSKHRGQIYGIAALWIMLFHLQDGTFMPFVSIDKLLFGERNLFEAALINGRIGVDIFLFLSGVSLFFAYSRKPDISSFLYRRMSRLLVPVYVLCVPRWLVEFLIVGRKPTQFIMSVSLTKLFVVGDNTIWFVSCIALCYLMYPLIYESCIRARTDWRRVFLVGMVCCWFLLWFWFMHKYNTSLFRTYEIWVGRIPAFLAGCAVGPLVKNKRRIPKWLVLLSVVFCVVYLLVFEQWVSSQWWWRAMSVLVGPAFSVSFAATIEVWQRAFAHVRARRSDDEQKGESLQVASSCATGQTSWLDRALASVGGVSLELYLTHIFVRQVVCVWVGVPNSYRPALFPVVIAASIALAYALRYVSDLILRKMSKGA